MQISLRRLQLRQYFSQRLLSAVVLLGVTACSGSYPQSTLNPASDFGVSIDNLFTGIFWWAVFVFVVVEGLLIITIVRFRARPGRPKPKFIHGHTALEIGWTLAPAVILVFIAVPTIQTIFRHDGTAPDDALQVEVVGSIPAAAWAVTFIPPLVASLVTRWRNPQTPNGSRMSP